MSVYLDDFTSSYKKLIENFRLMIENNLTNKELIENLSCKIRLLNKELSNLTGVTDEINQELLKNKACTTDEEKKEIKEMEIMENTLKVFSPYIILYRCAQLGSSQ